MEIAEGALRRGMELRAQVLEGARLDTQRNHTATHLLHSALHRVLGPAAQQAGSLVAPERLRFDFNWGEPVGEAQLEEIERIVNAEIVRNLPVSKQYMAIDEARAAGAMALFGEKYGERVRVVSIGDGSVSRELCGGCHVARTGDIGFFKVLAERGIAAGVRRIEAVTGRGAVEWVQGLNRAARALAHRYQTSFERLAGVLQRRDEQLEKLQDELRALKLKLASGDAGGGEIRSEAGGVAILARRVPEMPVPDLRNLADTLRQKLGSGVVVLGMEAGGKATLLVSVTEDLTDRLRAGDIVKALAPIVGGRGGGRPNLAQAGGPHPEKLGEAMEAAAGVVGQLLSD